MELYSVQYCAAKALLACYSDKLTMNKHVTRENTTAWLTPGGAIPD